jgi:8-oxo-dGTP pyrophosphatase MutT (NUDIX family)
MPLESGSSQSAFVHNLKAELAAGKPQKQALAIAYSKKCGDARDMAPNDWRGLLRGFVKFIKEEGAEPEHKEPVKDAAQPIAAGTIHVAPDGRVLLLKRSGEETNYANHWSLPGGSAEEGETPGEAADRETTEEIGVHPPGGKTLFDERDTPNGMRFHTFIKFVPETFEPKLNDEHSDHRWADLADLPSPLHPAVADVLGRLASMGRAAEDEAVVLALDRSSVRSYDRDGRLHVELTPISKATVNEYYGREIPGAERLGLDPARKYKMLRDPEELRRAAETSNNIQLMRRHVKVDAKDPQKDEVVGSTGTDAVFKSPYLMNSLVIWAKPDIDAVEREEKRELSSSYHYRADMTPGVYEGQPYDGVMRDIFFNHVAVVKEGRAGHDVLVGDEKESEDMTNISDVVARRFDAIKAFVSPRLAPGQSIDGLDKILALDAAPEMKPEGADRKAKDEEESRAEKKREEAEDKKAADKKAKDEEEEEASEKKKAEDRKARDARRAMDRKARDEAPEGLKGFLKGKMNAEDYKAACDKLDEEREAEDAEKDDLANPDPEWTNERAQDKKAMDELVRDGIEKSRREERAAQRAIYDARSFVRPWVGELSMAFDSAEDVYAAALKARGVKTEGKHPAAYKDILAAQPKPGQGSKATTLANDAAIKGAKPFAERFPGAGAIRIG